MTGGNAVSRRACACACTVWLACGAAYGAEEAPTPRTTSVALAGSIWAATQLVPSPLFVIGQDRVGGGVRWQLTPLLYSFGIAESPLRSFLITPIARHSGSVELHVSPEWACCAASGSSWLLRSGLRVYLPLLEHGEQLSWALGTSYYRTAAGTGSDGQGGFAFDAGLYTFVGVLGLTVTVSPALTGRELISALNIRYF